MLDQHVPRALMELFCGDHDCRVTGENTGLEPGAFKRKYYARGVGFILGVDLETGDSVQLVGCSFDPRCCHGLPTAVTIVKRPGEGSSTNRHEIPPLHWQMVTFRQARGQVDRVAYALSTNPWLSTAVAIEKVIQLTNEQEKSK